MNPGSRNVEEVFLDTLRSILGLNLAVNRAFPTSSVAGLTNLNFKDVGRFDLVTLNSILAFILAVNRESQSVQ